MVHKTLYSLIFALVAVPGIASAEIYRDLSFIPQYDSARFDLGGSDINLNNCPGNDTVYYLDGNGYRLLNWQSTLGTTARVRAIQCDRNPIVTELVDVSPLYSGSTYTYHFTTNIGSVPTSQRIVLEDINGIAVNVTNYDPAFSTSTNFIDSSGVKVTKRKMQTATYSGLDYAIRAYQLGGRIDTYAYIVTNENLDYIDTLSELYALIDSLDSNIPAVGDTGYTFEDFNTKFTGLDITGTSTVTISAGHFIDGSEIDPSVPALNPTIVRFGYGLEGNAPSYRGETITPYTLDAIATTSTNLNALPDGEYDLIVQFYNANAVFNGGIIPFANSYILGSFEIASGTLVAVGESFFYDYDSISQGGTDPRYLDCSLSNITNCFINALIYVFLPSESTLNRFLSLKDELAEVIPFGYFIYIYDRLNTLEVDPLVSPIIPELPLQSAVFDPLRTGIGYALWLYFAIHLYRRFKTIEY